MKKIIKSSYSMEISVGLQLLIFVLAFFLSSQLFTVPWHNLSEGGEVYFGMFLVSSSVMIMVLILWEELLFPVQVKYVEGGETYRNHRNKLITQLLIYLLIPAIYIFIYMNYEVKEVRFVIWSSICIILPVVVKLASGINNYNDFLTLTDEHIAYKDNQKEGEFLLKDVKQLIMMKHKDGHLEKIQLKLSDGKEVIIDLDDMELDDYFDAIEEYITTNYQHLIQR